MIKKVQERINLLEKSIWILESILNKFGPQTKSLPLRHLQNQIDVYKRELQIRREYPP